MKAYIVEDQYRNNQVLVYALDAVEARTAASNSKELCDVEWIDLQVKRAKYGDDTDSLTEREKICFEMVIELNELVNGWSYELRDKRLDEARWKEFFHKLDSIEQKNISAALDQLTVES